MSDESTDEQYKRLCREQKAAIARGERCWQCNKWIIAFQFPGHRQLCQDCKAADDPREFRHDSRVRCPKCRCSWDVYDAGDYDVQAEGEHGVTCPECDHEFEVSTTVSHHFKSPELMPEGDA